jgi:hypothetical protein
VELVRIGELYFVRDGHHRISVGRALGRRTVEAQVVEWQVSGPLPWETRARASAHNLTDQPRFRDFWLALRTRLTASL